MPEFLQFLFSGLTVGAIYALVAVGFTLIYSSSDVINFAQGEFVMIGGMGTYVLSAAGVPLPIAALLAIVIAVAVGLLLRGLAGVAFDKNFHSLPPFLGAEPWLVGGATILPQSVIVLSGAGIIVLLLWLFMRRTLYGKATLATAANRMAARLVGIDTSRVVMLSFAISAAIGAIGGILVTPIVLTSYDVGTLLALKGFAAAMLGGIGNPLGAIV